ncbi:MAG: VWA domain-containing protein, partial [Nitrospinota bacterium]|nr:VWA domain-containing protein [Nitrospinota bacterium]
KVIIIISDGQPNGSAHNLIEAVGELGRRGYRIIAVGVEDDYVREIYPNHVVVEDMAQLATELIALLERELLGRRRCMFGGGQNGPPPSATQLRSDAR